MAEIRPFRGLRYGEDAGPLDRLIAPPYDVLSPAQRVEYGARSPHNIVHLTLPEGKVDDRSKFVKYTRSAAALGEWRRSGVLALEQAPSLYRYSQSFQIGRDSTSFTRTALIGLIKIEPFSSGIVLPHEETFPKHKEDRLRLLEATRSHLESIFGLYEDPSGDLLRLIGSAPSGPPREALVEGIRHKLEPIADPRATAAITAALAGLRIWIADGHHRYETALAFREALRERSDPVAEDYMVIALSSMSDVGLVLMPTHRIVPSLRALAVGAAAEKLMEAFRVEECHSSSLPKRMQEAQGEGRRTFGVALEGGRGLLLTPIDRDGLVSSIPGAASPRLKSLDVTLLQEIVLGKLLGLPSHEPLEYSRDAADAIRTADEGGGPAFLMLPPSVEDMKEIALAGERMPQKSTYYYPKVFSGLVLWSLADF